MAKVSIWGFELLDFMENFRGLGVGDGGMRDGVPADCADCADFGDRGGGVRGRRLCGLRRFWGSGDRGRGLCGFGRLVCVCTRGLRRFWESEGIKKSNPVLRLQ